MTTLLSSLKASKIKLHNRIVMPPMATYLATENGEVTENLIKHYLRRAQSGTGLIITEHSYVDDGGKVNKNQLGSHRDANITGLKKLVDTIHATGAKVGLQITHAGASCSRQIIGQDPVGPSPVSNPGGKGVPRELTLKDIKLIKSLFANAALRAKMAGFDMVEIHGAHGYLLNQFMSPLTNKRTDEYGGSLENRILFPLEVIMEVRKKLGDEFCIFYRLGADDRYPTGLTPEDSRVIALRLIEAGVDVLDLSGGHCGSRIDTGPGFFVYLARVIKPAVNVPVLITGGVTSPTFANKLITENIADLVGVGRAQLKDPNWTRTAYGKL